MQEIKKIISHLVNAHLKTHMLSIIHIRSLETLLGRIELPFIQTLLT